MKNVFLYIRRYARPMLCCLFFTAITILSHAQPPDIGGDVDDVPLDGGLSLVVAAGIGYGVRKASKLKHRK